MKAFEIVVALSITAISCADAALVMGGYDVVAYFSLSDGDSGVLGSADYSYNLTSSDQGDEIGPYEFHFSSHDNLAEFASSPWTFAPKYGGF